MHDNPCTRQPLVRNLHRMAYRNRGIADDIQTPYNTIHREIRQLGPVR